VFPVHNSDVKRGQNLEAELRPRPGPWGRGRDRGQSFDFWGQGRGCGQFLDVEAKEEAKDKVMNKKYTKWWLTSCRRIYIIMIKTTQLNLSFSSSRTVTIFYHSVMSCSRQSKVQTDWSVDLFLVAGSSAVDRGQAEAHLCISNAVNWQHCVLAGLYSP